MDFPTPLQLLLDPVSLMVITMFAGLFFWESIFPRNTDLPKVKYALARGIFSFFVFFFLSSYLPILTDGFLASYQLVDLSKLPLVVQITVGLLTYQLFIYVWHRNMHSSDTLWRVFHQLHHSSERIDIPSAFYFSPMDMIAFTLLGSTVFALIMGVSVKAITVIILSLNFLSIFQHANIKTPQWLGYFIQRPEQHAVHHEKGVHKYNYSDFPFYDLLFGTFRNPKDFKGENGFQHGDSNRIGEMLAFKDLNKPTKKVA